MATKSLGTLTLDLVAKTGLFEAGLDKAGRKTKTTAADMAKYGKAIGIGIAAGVTVAAASLVAMTRAQLEVIDNQSKMSRRLRTSYESLAALARASDLAGVSMAQLETASRALDVNLGKAAQGSLAQAEALDKLGLSAAELQRLPLDQKLIAVNKALQENVSITERAAVASALYGSRSQSVIQQLDPATIAEAAKQARIFGLALSDIDGLKIEMANDAMSNFGLISQGIGTQLAVEFAPILKAVGDEFLQSAEEAGGLGNVIQEVVRDSVKAIAFLIDAVDGVGVAFRFSARSIGLVGAMTVEYLSKAQDLALEFAKFTPPGATFNALSGGMLTDLQKDLQETSALAKLVGDDLVKLTEDDLVTPLKGQQLLEFYDKAQKAAQKAAKAAAAAGSGAGRADPPGTGPASAAAAEEAAKAAKAAEKLADATAEQIRTLQFQAATVGKSSDEIQLLELANDGASKSQLALAKAALATVNAYEANTKAQEDYAALVSDLRTDEERLNDTLSERLKILNSITNIPTDERSQVASRIAADAFEQAPEFAGLAPEIGGAGGELRKIDKAQAELEDWYTTQLEMLADYRKNQSELNTQWDEREIALKRQHEAAIADIEYARQQASLVATEDLFGSLADAARVYAGEQSDIFRVLFAAQKAAAIAQSLVAIQTGIAQAANNPFPANLAAMASVAAATASIISNIASVTIGQAHDGMDSIPKSGSWNLEKGERVTTGKTSAKLDRVLSDVQSSMREGGSATNLRIVNSFDSGEVVGGYLGSKDGERAVMNIVRRHRRTIQSMNL